MEQDNLKGQNELTNEKYIEKIKSVNIDRRKFLKFASVVAGAAAISPYLAGCGASKETPPSGNSEGAAGGTAGIVIQKGLPMCAMFTSMDNPYYSLWNKGAEQCVNALGMKYEAYLSESKPELQIQQVETKAGQGVKMMFIAAPEASNVATLGSMANEYKFYMTNTWESPNWWLPLNSGDYFVTYFTPDSISTGYYMAKTLFDAMGKKGNFVQVSGFPGATPDWHRTYGISLALKEYPDINFLESQPGKWNRIDARNVMEDMITTHPNINGVFAQNDDIAIGAMNALEERGIKVPIIGCDANKENIELILQGKLLGTVASHPFWQGSYSAVRVFDAFHGWKPTTPERMMFTESLVLTTENINAYYDKFYGSETFPFDWELMSRVIHPDDWDPQNGVFPLDPDKMWAGQEKPKGFTYWTEVAEAKANGEYEKIEKMYADHYKKKIL